MGKSVSDALLSVQSNGNRRRTWLGLMEGRWSSSLLIASSHLFSLHSRTQLSFCFVHETLPFSEPTHLSPLYSTCGNHNAWLCRYSFVRSVSTSYNCCSHNSRRILSDWIMSYGDVAIKPFLFFFFLKKKIRPSEYCSFILCWKSYLFLKVILILVVSTLLWKFLWESLVEGVRDPFECLERKRAFTETYFSF